MGWGKLDDNLHDHHKVDELNDVAPMGLWTLCLTWAHRHRKTRPDPAFVPWGTVDRLGRRKARAYAKELLRVGLWEPADGGIRIHDFKDFLPGGTDEERSEKARAAANARWEHARQDANGHAPEHPPGMPEDASRASCAGSDSHTDSLSTSNEVLPTPLRLAGNPPPDDIEKLCSRLVDHVVRNGCRRPTVTAKWREAARLLFDRDNRPVPEVIRVLDWSQTDDFWRGNVQSLPKFREKYDQLRLQMDRKASGRGANGYDLAVGDEEWMR